MKIEIDIDSIDNENLRKYITGKIESSQFDEAYKIKNTILALIQKSERWEIKEMFDEILSDKSNFI